MSGGSVQVLFDPSGLDDLEGFLAGAAARVAEVRREGLDHAASAIRDKASATASSYPHATGALAADVSVSGSGLSKKVGSNLREAFFLEFGSPTTGGPRAWLSEPARNEMSRLLVELGAAAVPR